MKRRRFVRQVRQTRATRLWRARLARERQGPNGRWESNQKKQEARIVKRKSAKLDAVFEAAKSKRLADEAAAFSISEGLVAELMKVSKASALRRLMPRLESLAVSASLLRRSPSIVEALTDASKRCKKMSKDEAVVALLAAWEERLQASTPRVRLSSKCAFEKNPEVSRTPPAASKPGAAAAPPRASLTPKPRPPATPSHNLGNLFAKIRLKNGPGEAKAVKQAKAIIIDLEKCPRLATMKALMPRLQKLWVTKGVLQKVPSLIEGLERAAKRCRKSRDESVTQLLEAWREVQRRQEEEVPQPEKHDMVKSACARSSSGSPAKKRSLPLPDEPNSPILPIGGGPRSPPLKQRKITAFLCPKAVMTAGG